MTPIETLNTINHPAFNLSWFARKFYRIEKKYDPRINKFIKRTKARKLNAAELRGLNEVLTEFAKTEI